MIATRDPWNLPVSVTQIPETGLHREFEADQVTREAMAEIAGLRNISSARATLDLMPKRGGRVHVTGHVRARVGQTCVVTLDPIESEIDEEIDLMFAPGEQISQQSDLVEEAAENDAEIADPPEAIIDGIIDLGRLATDVLFLALDPYPRKPGAVFEPHVEADDPEDHPFAALKVLRDSPSSSPERSPPHPNTRGDKRG